VFESVLLGLDGSAEALGAVEAAAGLGLIGAASKVATVSAVELARSTVRGVWPLTGAEWVARREETLKRCVRPVDELLRGLGIPVQEELVLNSAPALAIRSVSERFGAELVVLGRSEKSSFERLFLGSASLELVESLDKPVLLVPRGFEPPESGVPWTLLVCTDFSEGAKASLVMAGRIARERACRLILVHCRSSAGSLPRKNESPASALSRYEESSQKSLARSVREFESQGIDASAVFCDKEAPQGILDASESRGASLIVIATNGRTNFDAGIIGSVAAGVTKRARVPVLVVRAEGAEIKG